MKFGTCSKCKTPRLVQWIRDEYQWLCDECADKLKSKPAEPPKTEDLKK